MDLLRTLLIYMSMIFISSVQTAPEPTIIATQTVAIEASATPTAEPTPSPTPVPTPAITPNTAYKNIRVGDNGDEVRALQEKLAEYGYYTGEIDGRFGNQTRRAVEQFQYNQGLSADGVAGRYTLTVLYESNDVRPAPTPAPTATETSGLVTAEPSQTPIPIGTSETTSPTAPATTDAATDAAPLAAAPTDATTDAPTTDASTTDAPSNASTTAAPTETPAPVFAAMEGYTISLQGHEDEVLMSRVENQTETPLTPYTYGDSVYVPLFRILEAANVIVIPNETIEVSEYGFAIGSDIYRVTFSEDQSGAPIDLEVYLGDVPQVLPQRDIRLAQQELYLPMESVESLIGMRFALDDEQQLLIVSMPGSDAEPTAEPSAGLNGGAVARPAAYAALLP